MKNFLEKVQKKGPAGRKKDKTERVTGLGRRTREAIAKWNQMTALRFQGEGRGGDIRHPPPPFGERRGIVSDNHCDAKTEPTAHNKHSTISL